MAKPIRATPTLKGDDAKNFVKEFLKEQKAPNKARIDLIKTSMTTKFNII